MRAQITWTLVTELLVILSAILLIKLAAQFLGAAGYGEYAVSRRAVALMYLPLVMGFGIAAPRYIAIARAGAMPGYSARSFAFATLTAGLLPIFGFILLLNLNPANAASLLFGSSEMERLVLPATIALAGGGVHGMVYAVFRGRGEMIRANSLQLLNQAIIPVTAVAVIRTDAPTVVAATGAAWLVTSGIALLTIVLARASEQAVARSVGDHLKVLFRFGLPRVPGEFALVGIFAIPALLALRAHGVVAAGQFSAALSMITIAAGAFTPLGIVLLPRASAQAARGDLAGVRHLVVRMLIGGVALIAAGVAVGEILIPPFVRWYLGPEFVPAIPIFRVCLLGAVPYVVYVLLRNIVDALEVKAVNSRNLLISLGVLLALCLVTTDLMGMSWSLVGALSLLSILSLRETHLRLGSSAIRAAAAAAAATT